MVKMYRASQKHILTTFDSTKLHYLLFLLINAFNIEIIYIMAFFDLISFSENARLIVKEVTHFFCFAKFLLLWLAF